ncbi:Rrf2 family transcriptional regulator [Oleispirillum naphthae]|uniref:RrF2 family transcriptional regulator n=1 Tax=Oleispirillum naphthae TaxID=2838853 RepID=UPI0030822B1F
MVGSGDGVISQKTKYALRALLALAESDGAHPLRIRDIAGSRAIPRKFLEAILLELKAGGLVASFRGKNGGYVLAKPAEEISLADVMRRIDGPIAPLPCVSRRFYSRCADCSGDADCAFRDAFDQAHAANLRVLEATTIARLCALENEADTAQGRCDAKAAPDCQVSGKRLG